MPHLVIECSENVLRLQPPEKIIKEVYETALASGLFAESGVGGIKVRINPYKYYTTVGTNDDFVHVFANIMEGRTIEQRKALSDSIVRKLKELLPDVPILSMNIREIEKATYCNKSMV